MTAAETPEAIRVVIADDHPISREGIRAYLGSRPGIRIVGEASDGLRAIEIARAEVPDVLVADITMPDLSGIEVARELGAEAPRVKVLILTMHEDPDCLAAAVRAGARGYLMKDSGPADLLMAIERVHAGETFVTAGKSRLLLERAPWTSSLHRGLSLRERQVLSCVVNGMTNKEIANRLDLSPRTIESHRVRIKAKLRLRTNAALVRYAITRGFGGFP